MELNLTQAEADALIIEAKELIRTFTATLDEGSKGRIPIISISDGRKFTLAYFYTLKNMSLSFFDEKTKLTLVRINLNNSFHKNSDGNRVYGNRVNLFSEDEFYKKSDGFTHYKAYSLPVGVLSDTDDFLVALGNLLNYTHTKQDDKLKLSIATDLNI